MDCSLGWKPVAKSWLQKLTFEGSTLVIQVLEKLFADYVDDAISVILKKCNPVLRGKQSSSLSISIHLLPPFYFILNFLFVSFTLYLFTIIITSGSGNYKESTQSARLFPRPLYSTTSNERYPRSPRQTTFSPRPYPRNRRYKIVVGNPRGPYYDVY